MNDIFDGLDRPVPAMQRSANVAIGPKFELKARNLQCLHFEVSTDKEFAAHGEDSPSLISITICKFVLPLTIRNWAESSIASEALDKRKSSR